MHIVIITMDVRSIQIATPQCIDRIAQHTSFIVWAREKSDSQQFCRLHALESSESEILERKRKINKLMNEHQVNKLELEILNLSRLREWAIAICIWPVYRDDIVEEGAKFLAMQILQI